MTTLPLDKLCRRIDAAIANGRGCEMPAGEIFLLAHYVGGFLRETADAAAGRVAFPQAAERGETVYFVRRGVDGPIKIGRARNPQKRVAVLQTASAEPLSLLAVTDRFGEWHLHLFYQREHIRGEWFSPSPRLLAFISKIAG